MTELPERLFADPVRQALQTRHRSLAMTCGDACRYPGDVAPFAAVARPTAGALQDLRALLVPGESVWLMGTRFPQVEGLVFEATLECLQMMLPESVAVPEADPAHSIVPLPETAAEEMVALTTLAFPGFFRIRTCAMGNYYGIRAGGELIAMGGERLALDGDTKSYIEISGVCTHPGHRGRGFGASLIWQVARDHRRAGAVSWLHVSAANTKAIALYLRMGFVEAHRVMLHRVRLGE